MTFQILEQETDFCQNGNFKLHTLTIKGLKKSKRKIEITNFW